MSNLTRLTSAMEQAKPQGERRATISDLIQQQADEIKKALPAAAALTPQRLTRVALTLIRTNRALAGCNAPSLLGALMTSAQLGLEPGPMGHVYLVPRGQECTFQLGYKGMIELARRGGVNVKARTVYAGDKFKIIYGMPDRVEHEPCTTDEERGKVVGYYMVAVWDGGEFALFHTPGDVERIRLRSDSGKQGRGPWATDYDAMARKTVVRAAFNSGQVPMTVDLARAINADETVRTKLDEDALDEEPPADTWTTPSTDMPAVETSPASDDAPDVIVEAELVEHAPSDDNPPVVVEEVPQDIPPSAAPAVGDRPLPPAGTDTLPWLRSQSMDDIRAICDAYDIRWPKTKVERDLQPIAALIDEANA